MKIVHVEQEKIPATELRRGDVFSHGTEANYIAIGTVEHVRSFLDNLNFGDGDQIVLSLGSEPFLCRTPHDSKVRKFDATLTLGVGK